MKVLFLQSAASVRFNYKKGREYDLSPLEAGSFIRAGIATATEKIEQHKITYEHAVQDSDSSNNISSIPNRSKVAPKSNIKRRGSQNNRVNKKRDKLG